MQAYAASERPRRRGGRAQRVRRPRHLCRARLGARDGRDLALLRQRDADERLASLQALERGAWAGGCSRAARTVWSPRPCLFFSQEVSDESQTEDQLDDVVDVRDHLARPLHGHARQPRRDDGDPGHPQGPARRDQRPRVDRQRVHAHLRGAASHRRRSRRPLRTPADVRDRDRDLHGRFGSSGARADDRRARRGARGAGARRRDRHAADAHDPLGRRARGTSRRVPRRVGRHQRPRRRVRPACRRRRRQRLLLALGLLAQRPRRDRTARARAAPRRDEGAVRECRPARPRARERRPVRDRVGARPRQLRRVGLRRDRRRPDRRCCSDGAVRRLGASGRASDAADAVLP